MSVTIYFTNGEKTEFPGAFEVEERGKVNMIVEVVLPGADEPTAKFFSANIAGYSVSPEAGEPDEPNP